jgi:hypothetical protein
MDNKNEPTIHRGKCLLEYLREHGLDDYGSVIPLSRAHEVLDIQYPAWGSRAIFDALEMVELNAIGYVRDVLLGEGKYLAKTRAGYRVLLPSENAAQVDRYHAMADRKLARALKLVKNTPVGGALPDRQQTETRLMMKRESVRGRSVFGAVSA